MGLISQLLLLPVAPVRFTVWVAEQLEQEAQRTTSSPQSVVQRLDELEQARERGEIDAEEAERLQGEVIEDVAAPAGEPDEEERDG